MQTNVPLLDTLSPTQNVVSGKPLAFLRLVQGLQRQMAKL